MREVQVLDGRIVITDDPEDLIDETLNYAMSMQDEIDELIAPETGRGFNLDGVFTLYRARTREELPEVYWDDPPLDPEHKEVWVMCRDV